MVYKKPRQLTNNTSILLSLILVGCSGSPSDDDEATILLPPVSTEQDPNPPPIGSVEGTWSTSCFYSDSADNNSYQINTYKRRGSETFYIARYYEARRCTDGFFREQLVTGMTEEVGSVVEPIFGVTATSVFVAVSGAFENAVMVDSTPNSFHDLIYRTGATVALGLPGSEDLITTIPQQLNWVVGYRYVDI